MNKILFSKNSDDWATPKSLYSYLIDKLKWFDPCPLNSKFDGLKIEWQQKNFVNPPFSKIKEFIKKAIEESKKGKKIILLIPARTDTKYFRELVNYGSEISFITGRLHYNESNSAPFPSCIVYLTGRETRCEWIDRRDIELL